MNGLFGYGFAVPNSPNFYPSRHRGAGEGVQAGRASRSLGRAVTNTYL